MKSKMFLSPLMKGKAAWTTIFVLAVLATVAWQVNIANAQVTDGLVSVWTFNGSDIDGTTVKDIAGNNDGNMVGDPQPAAGMGGEGLALLFDGVDDSVRVPADPSLASDTFTIEMWLNPVVIKPMEGMWPNTILGREQYQGCGFRCRITAGGSIQYWNTESAGNMTLTSETTLSPGTFYHLAVTYDGTEGKLYIEGELEASREGSQVICADVDLTIVGGVGGTTLGNVIVDEVRYYNRALSDAEVQLDYVGGPTSVNSKGKLAFTWGEIKASK
jgi:hypothetical protein